MATNKVLKFVLLATFAVYYNSCDANEAESYRIKMANVDLVDVSNNLELANVAMIKNYEEILIGLSENIVFKLISVRAMAPDVSMLNGRSLETLCELIEDPFVFRYSGHNDVNEVVNEYLFSINKEVHLTIAKYQQSMRGKGCKLTPSQ